MSSTGEDLTDRDGHWLLVLQSEAKEHVIFSFVCVFILLFFFFDKKVIQERTVRIEDGRTCAIFSSFP